MCWREVLLVMSMQSQCCVGRLRIQIEIRAICEKKNSFYDCKLIVVLSILR
jgi:hypothetical protein